MFDYNDFAATLSLTGETGYVTETKYPLAITNGLPGAQLNELIMFETGDVGYVFSLEVDTVQVGVLGRAKVPVGTRATRTGQKIGMRYSATAKGKVVDPIGNVILGEDLSDSESERLPIFVDIPPLVSRRNIQEQLITGISVVDILLPIGKGQRELLIGDRKTGKRQVVLQACYNALKSGIKVIYVAAGQNNSDIQIVWKFFHDHGVAEEVHIIGTSPLDSPCLIYLSPFSGMAIAEYYARQGYDALVVIEDLTTHAQFYREFSLLSGRFPGRESYPGDIFFTHAHLLERAGNFKFEGVERDVSITCLPLLHAAEGDISSYIATNSIGITDGHLFFDKEKYLKGLLPPVHVGLSVTRAGKQTQTSILRDVNRFVSTFLNEYENTKSFAAFGSETNQKVKDILAKGDALEAFFRQIGAVNHTTISDLFLIGMIWAGVLTETSSDKYTAYRKNIDENFAQYQTEMFEEFKKLKNLKELQEYTNKYKEKMLSICGIGK